MLSNGSYAEAWLQYWALLPLVFFTGFTGQILLWSLSLLQELPLNGHLQELLQGLTESCSRVGISMGPEKLLCGFTQELLQWTRLWVLQYVPEGTEVPPPQERSSSK